MIIPVINSIMEIGKLAVLSKISAGRYRLSSKLKNDELFCSYCSDVWKFNLI